MFGCDPVAHPVALYPPLSPKAATTTHRIPAHGHPSPQTRAGHPRFRRTVTWTSLHAPAAGDGRAAKPMTQCTVLQDACMQKPGPESPGLIQRPGAPRPWFTKG